jgi:arylsulfatase A-like enzyme
MPSHPSFRSTLFSLWLRFVALGIGALVFAEALVLSQGQAQGWTFYLTTPEVGFEVVVRLVAAALAGAAIGTIGVVLFSPYLWHFKGNCDAAVDRATRVAVVVTLFVISWFALEALIKWSYDWLGRGPKFYLAVRATYLLTFVAALCIPRARKQVVTSLDGLLGEKMTRRTAIATVAGTAALVATEFALSRRLPSFAAAAGPQMPKPRVLLITFDALSAEDMSTYGSSLPTTPNIDAFARKSTVFTNFYSSSTFTTPCIATMLTGLYPSESLVYQLQGRMRSGDPEKNLAQAMRVGGYSTGAFLSNGYAYRFARSLGNAFDFLPEPVFQEGGLQRLWDVTMPIHQDSGIGFRGDEYQDLKIAWNSLVRMPQDLPSRFRAVASFENARQILSGMPNQFFLWVHVMTPHYPYLPDAIDRGRFLHDDGSQSLDQDDDRLWYPRYSPAQQSQVDRRRLRYDEFVATADRAFGAFMAELEDSGKLQDTAVIVSADHGESFEGGVYRHKTPYLTRPVIHVPLIIRMPGQQDGRTVPVTADQAALAPTILELAGVLKPDTMRGHSLVEWLNRDGEGDGEGLAFSQYFERNSVFKPLRRGSVGVIDGRYQYVHYLESNKGILRPLNEAQIWNLDRSAEHPAQARALREAIRARFPDLIQNPT